MRAKRNSTKKAVTMKDVGRPCRMPEGPISKADLRRRMRGLSTGVAKLLVALGAATDAMKRDAAA